MVHFTVTLPYSGVSEYREAARDQFILTLKKKKEEINKKKKREKGGRRELASKKASGLIQR